MRLGIILRKWRLMADLTQQQIAEQIGIEVSRYSRIERCVGSVTAEEFLAIMTWLSQPADGGRLIEPPPAVQQSIPDVED